MNNKFLPEFIDSFNNYVYDCVLVDFDEPKQKNVTTKYLTKLLDLYQDSVKTDFYYFNHLIESAFLILAVELSYGQYQIVADKYGDFKKIKFMVIK